MGSNRWRKAKAGLKRADIRAARGAVRADADDDYVEYAEDDEYDEYEGYCDEDEEDEFDENEHIDGIPCDQGETSQPPDNQRSMQSDKQANKQADKEADNKPRKLPETQSDTGSAKKLRDDKRHDQKQAGQEQPAEQPRHGDAYRAPADDTAKHFSSSSPAEQEEASVILPTHIKEHLSGNAAALRNLLFHPIASAALRLLQDGGAPGTQSGPDFVKQGEEIATNVVTATSVTTGSSRTEKRPDLAALVAVPDIRLLPAPRKRAGRRVGDDMMRGGK